VNVSADTQHNNDP